MSLHHLFLLQMKIFALLMIWVTLSAAQKEPYESTRYADDDSEQSANHDAKGGTKNESGVGVCFFVRVFSR